MAKKDYTGKVEDILPAVIEEQVKHNLGAIRFLRKDKKTEGKLYFRGGLVYGLELSTYKPNIVNRVITNEHIKDNARELILQRYENNLADVSVVQFVLTSQLFPEKPLLGYIKDYFLDAFDELITWDQTTAEWKAGEEPRTPTVPNTNPFDLIEKAKRRRSFLESQVSPVWNSTIKQMELLGFRRNFKFEASDYATSVLITVADSSWTIGSAAEYLGMSRFNVKKTLFELWQEGIIDVIHPSGLLITNRTKESISSGIKAPHNTGSLGGNRELELMPGDTAEPLPVASAVPSVYASEPAGINPSAPQSSQPVVSEPVVASQPVSQVSEQVVASQPPVDPSTNPQPIPRKEEMSNPIPATTPQGSSRLAAIAQQLREELSNADQMIQAASERKTTLVQYQASLQNEKDALLTQLQSVDVRMATTSADIEAAEAEINRLTAERSEITSMLQG